MVIMDISLFRDLDRLRQAVREAGGVPREFNTIGICDGVAMGHAGMKYSLPSREIIADSVETMINAHWFDGMICIPNCDKIVPGMLMGAVANMAPDLFLGIIADVGRRFPAMGLLTEGMVPINQEYLAALGVGNRGSSNVIHDYVETQDDVRIVAAYDCFASRRTEFAARVDGHYGGTYCTPVADWRDVLAREDVDGVIISTPDHGHFLPALEARADAIDAGGGEIATIAGNGRRTSPSAG